MLCIHTNIRRDIICKYTFAEKITLFRGETSKVVNPNRIGYDGGAFFGVVYLIVENEKHLIFI